MKAERGSTLIEVAVVVSIMGLVAAPLASTFLAVVRHQQVVTESVERSRDGQLLALHLARDLASSTSAAVGGTACSGQASLLTLSSSTPVYTPAGAGTPARRDVSYALVPYGAGRSALRRFVCVGGVETGPSAPVVRRLGPADAVTATVAADTVQVTLRTAGERGGRQLVAGGRVGTRWSP